jgi:outer membrane immunogenic protein
MIRPVLLVGSLALACVGANGAMAADLMGGGYDPVYASSESGFAGLYLGADAGFAQLPSAGRSGTLGVVVGNNVTVNPGVVAGVEGQIDFVWNSETFAGVDAVGLGRIGANFGDATLVYAEAGAGVVDDEASYIFGMGVEQAVTDAIAVRGEVQGSGAFGEDMDGGKAKVGLLWRLR